jgi:hypothetical protein
MKCCNCNKEFIKHICLTEKDSSPRIGDMTQCFGCGTIQVVSGHTLMTLETREATDEEKKEFLDRVKKIGNIMVKSCSICTVKDEKEKLKHLSIYVVGS